MAEPCGDPPPLPPFYECPEPEGDPLSLKKLCPLCANPIVGVDLEILGSIWDFCNGSVLKFCQSSSGYTGSKPGGTFVFPVLLYNGPPQYLGVFVGEAVVDALGFLYIWNGSFWQIQFNNQSATITILAIVGAPTFDGSKPGQTFFNPNDQSLWIWDGSIWTQFCPCGSSYPYNSMGPNSVLTDCCPNAIPAKLTITLFNESNCPGLDGVEIHLIHEGTIWNGGFGPDVGSGGCFFSPTSWTLQCLNDVWQLTFIYGSAGGGSGITTSATPASSCDPFEQIFNFAFTIPGCCTPVGHWTAIVRPST